MGWEWGWEPGTHKFQLQLQTLITSGSQNPCMG